MFPALGVGPLVLAIGGRYHIPMNFLKGKSTACTAVLFFPFGFLPLNITKQPDFPQGLCSTGGRRLAYHEVGRSNGSP